MKSLIQATNNMLILYADTLIIYRLKHGVSVIIDILIKLVIIIIIIISRLFSGGAEPPGFAAISSSSLHSPILRCS
jgi:hypothetical protein